MMKKEIEVKTTIGELVGYFDGFYLNDKGEEGTWLTEKEYEAVSLPYLDPLEVRRYKKLMRKGDKAEALTKLMYYVVGLKTILKCFLTEQSKNTTIAWLRQLSKGAITIEGTGTIAFRKEGGA